MKVLPCPSSDSTSIRPPNRSTILLQIGNPSPVPCTKSFNFSKRVNMGVENRQKKILIAEDVESSYLQINAFLKKEYTILWVPNGEEAVKSFIREKPDLILMDIRMPVMNGIQATAKIRAISQEIPIIAITAYAFCPEGERALEAGCNEVIAKPYPLEKLKETIETYL